MTSITVAIPSSILSVESGLLLKTLKVHQVIRFCSIFGVSSIAVYKDPFTNARDHEAYLKLFKKIHNYLLTPPYLRKKLVQLDQDLRFIGATYPLRIKIFDVTRSGRIGELRIGLLTERGVEAGLGSVVEVENTSECRKFRDNLVVIKIVSLKPLRAVCVDDLPYLGPTLEDYSDLLSVIESRRKRGAYVLATSRFGKTPSVRDLLMLGGYSELLILFGSPSYGLYEIARAEGFELERFVDDVWNTVPRQRVKTVRTEEALIATLSLVNMYVAGSTISK